MKSVFLVSNRLVLHKERKAFVGVEHNNGRPFKYFNEVSVRKVNENRNLIIFKVR